MADRAGAAAGSAAPADRPRVLHILGSLTFGGIETWLVHMFRHQRESAVQHEVLLTREEPGAYEPEVRALGVPIHKLPIARGRLRWLLALKRFLRTHGPYAAVHAHPSLFSGAVLTAARAARVPVRIAHCHDQMSQGSLRRRLYRAAVLPLVKRVSTRRIGISDAAIEEIAGKGWRKDAGASVLLYGFDFSRNAGGAERGRQLRRQMGISDDIPVLGHVGRFDPVKNHEFLLEAFAAARGRLPGARLVLVGDGEILPQIKARAEALGLAGQVHFPGPSGDVPAYMAMFDLFVLPSLNEGLGIVCLEAQAAGTRSLVSDAVPAEVRVIPGAIESLPLSVGADAWAEAMARIAGLPSPDADDWRAQVENSRFGIRRCLRELDQIYLDAMEGVA